MSSIESMIDWVSTAKLRPYLSLLDEKGQEELKDAIKEKAENAYERRSNGSYLLLFRRLFFMAEKL